MVKNIGAEARVNWAVLAINVVAEAVAGRAFMKGVTMPKAMRPAFMARTIMMRTIRAANHQAKVLARGGAGIVMRMIGKSDANAARLSVPPVPHCDRRCTRGGDRAVMVVVLPVISAADLAAGNSAAAHSVPMVRSDPAGLLVRAARSGAMAPLAGAAVDAGAAAGGGASGLTARNCGSLC